MKKKLLGILVVLALVSIGCEEGQPLKLTTSSDKKVYEVGENINVELIVINKSSEDIRISEEDSFLRIIARSKDGREYRPTWYLDMYKERKIGDYHIIKRHEETRYKKKLSIKKSKWSAIGSSKETYKGVGLSYCSGSGCNIVPLPDIPEEYELYIEWGVNDYAKMECNKLGYEDCFTGTLAAKAITIEVVD